MRRIEFIAIHCTAGSQSTTIKQLELEFKRKGWKYPGYHYVILPDGKIHQMLAVEKVSNGVKGWKMELKDYQHRLYRWHRRKRKANGQPHRGTEEIIGEPLEAIAQDISKCDYPGTS